MIQHQIMPALPLPVTSFVGRARELAELMALLATPDCRLLTIVGPGGSGKTRLALELAARHAPAFVHGAIFLPLQPLGAPDSIVTALAEALHLPLTSQQPPLAYVLDALRDRETLLLLDNFEHLVDGAELCSTILSAAPDVRLLVTSRDVLNLQEEWRYPLEGLELPVAATTQAIEASSAVQLFAQRARRVRPDFDLAAERVAVARICQLVAGMPLAIELAATWTHTLTCATITDKIAHSLDLLTTSLRNVPERHRSMRAVLDQAWQQLNAQERAIFARLAVFRGGCTLETADQVTGATIDVLGALSDKALIRRDAAGRYQIHELLRQYAAGHLLADAEDAASTLDRFDAYYAGFLAERWPVLVAGGQLTAVLEVVPELENARTVWQRATDRGDVAVLHSVAHPLALYYHFRGPLQDGLAMLERIVASLRQSAPSELRDRALSLALIDTGWLGLRVGRLAAAEAAFAEGQAVRARLSSPLPPNEATDPQLGLGLLALFRGNYAEASRLVEAARVRAEADGYIADLPYALWILADIALDQGHPAAARRLALQSVAAAEAAGDRWGLAHGLNELGKVECALGAYDEARRHYEASYEVRAEFDDLQGMAEAIMLLGRVALLRGDPVGARQRFNEGINIHRQIGNASGMVAALHGLGTACIALGDLDAARAALVEALRAASKSGYVPILLAALTVAGDLLLQAGRIDVATRLIGVALAHPASDRETSARAQQALARYEAVLVPETIAAHAAHARQLDLAALTDEAQDALAALELAPAAAGAGLDQMIDFARALIDQPLPAQDISLTQTAEIPLHEELTAREREVLQLVADGLSNKAIADRLMVSVNTIQTHLRSVFGKLDVSSRSAAIRYAIQHGLVRLTP
jgi:predicted ATPase/DNA-binding CsgD family transcriptional regulator